MICKKYDHCVNQCDQIGRFIGLWATFQSLWQQLICPSSTFYGNFCKGVKIFNFSSEIINFYRHLAIFSGHTGCNIHLLLLKSSMDHDRISWYVLYIDSRPSWVAVKFIGWLMTLMPYLDGSLGSVSKSKSKSSSWDNLTGYLTPLKLPMAISMVGVMVVKSSNGFNSNN